MKRTFHPHAHDLHGITCVVDTTGSRVYVGRVDVVDQHGIVLMGVDVHEEQPGTISKREFVRRAARTGAWPRFDRVLVPAGEVLSVERLADVSPEKPVE